MKHERHRPFRHPFRLQVFRRRVSPRLVALPVWHVARFVGQTARLEDVGGAAVLSIDKTHDLCGHVSVVVGWTESVCRGTPPRGESEEIRRRDARGFGFRRQDAIDRRIGLIFLDARHIDEFLNGVFVRRVVPMPGHHVKGRVVLLTGM